MELRVYYIGSIPCSGGDIYHFGRKGMKWGKNIFGYLADNLQNRGMYRTATVARGISNGFKNANEFINGDQARQALNYARGSKQAQAQAAYNRTLPGMLQNQQAKIQEAMAKARQQVSTAYANAARVVGNQGKSAEEFQEAVLDKAKQTIAKGAASVAKYGSQYAEQIQKLGDNALKGGETFTSNILKKGSRGDNVKEFQQNLEKLGIKLDRYGSDGIYGSETKRAVMDFQRKHGLKVDGIVGDKTMAEIRKQLKEKKRKEQEAKKKTRKSTTARKTSEKSSKRTSATIKDLSRNGTSESIFREKTVIKK